MIDVIPYGPHSEQFGELRLPDGNRHRPLVILIHGGFWRDRYHLDLMHPVAEALYQRGYATWNIEYRRVGPTGGGYPTTLDDIALAVDRFGSDWQRTAVIGHSAGGHLALWNASRTTAGRPSDLTISLAGVADVVAANLNGVGGDATYNFFGADYADAVAAYRAAQPNPDEFRGRVVLIHGDRDQSVPLEQSTGLEGRVDRIEVLTGIDHSDVIVPTSLAWRVVFEELEGLEQAD